MKREPGVVALVHLDAVADHYQALRGLKIDEPILRAVILAQKVNRGLAEDVRKLAGIKDEKAKIFLPAYPKSMRRHL